MAVGDTYVFPGFLTLVLTQLFFPKPPTTFLTCFCRGERRKYARKYARKKSASTGDRSHNHQVMSQTRLPLSKEILDKSKLKGFADDKVIFSADDIQSMRRNDIQREDKLVGSRCSTIPRQQENYNM